MGYILEFKDEFDKEKMLEKLYNMKEDLCEICEMLEDADQEEEPQMQERGRMMRRGGMRRRDGGRMRDDRPMRDMEDVDYRRGRYSY